MPTCHPAGRLDGVRQPRAGAQALARAGWGGPTPPVEGQGNLGKAQRFLDQHPSPLRGLGFAFAAGMVAMYANRQSQYLRDNPRYGLRLDLHVTFLHKLGDASDGA